MSNVRRRLDKIERAMGPKVDAAYCQCPETARDWRWGAPIISVNADGSVVLGPEEDTLVRDGDKWRLAEVCERCGLPIQVIKLTWGDPYMEADG